MDAYLQTLLARFPEREAALLRLFRDSEVFRSICEELEMTEAAIETWSALPERALEYRRILDRLEREVWDLVTGAPLAPDLTQPDDTEAKSR